MTVRQGRWTAALATACLGAACLLAGPAAGSQAATPQTGVPRLRAQAATSVTLSGTGSWSLDPEIGDWDAALGGAPSPVDVTYIPGGSHDGRDAFVRGEVDFAVTGMPFTAEEGKQLADAHRPYVRLPIMPTALVFLFRSPVDGFREPVGDPAAGTFAPYEGPIRMPNVTVARTLLAVANTWNDQELKDAIGHNLGPYTEPMAPVVGSDTSAATYYLERYLATVAPGLWDQKLSESHQPAGLISESWPISSVPSRAGATAVMRAIANDSKPGGTSPTQGGNIGPVPPWAIKAARQQPGATMDLRAVELRNGAGEWVAPTPESIGTALRTGAGAPLSALASQDKGAYPLAWVDELVAPKTGLTPEKANALATLVRYAATAGQAAAAPRGDAVLPDPLVRKALAGANEIVAGNCTGPDVKIVSSTDPGPYAPAGSLREGTGTMLRCERVPAPAPAPPNAASTAGPPSPSSPTPTPPVGTGSAGHPPFPGSVASPGPSGRPASSGGGGLFDKISSVFTSLNFAPLPGVAPPAPDGLAPVDGDLPGAPEPSPSDEKVAATPKLPFPLPFSSSRSRDDGPVALLLAVLVYVGVYLAVLWRRRARRASRLRASSPE